MKLLTQEIIKQFPALYAQDGKGDNAIIYVKFFCPWNNWRWYATEYDPEGQEFFGYVMGHFNELGYFTLKDLQSVSKGGLSIERDIAFTPVTLGSIKNDHLYQIKREQLLT